MRSELAEMAAQSGVNPMAPPTDDLGVVHSPNKRRYGNPKGNISSQMASGLGMGHLLVPRQTG